MPHGEKKGPRGKSALRRGKNAQIGVKNAPREEKMPCEGNKYHVWGGKMT